MLIRWERQRIGTRRKSGVYRLDALLVEKPPEDKASGERIVKKLGSIEERFIKVNETGVRAFHQGLFWIVVDKSLDGLGLDPDVRSRLELEIGETVTRPKDDWPLWCVRCIPQYDE